MLTVSLLNNPKPACLHPPTNLRADDPEGEGGGSENKNDQVNGK